MRRHVQGVTGRRGNLRVRACGVQRPRGVLPIVERVNDEVRRTRMIGVLPEHGFRELARLQPRVLDDRMDSLRGEHGQCIKEGSLVIVWVRFVEAAHGLLVCEIAGRLVARTVKNFERSEVGLLARGWGACGARSRSGSEPSENASSRSRILGIPDALVVGHRLAPVGHGKVRLEGLRLLELLQCVEVAEAVQPGDALQEMGLRLGCA